MAQQTIRQRNETDIIRRVLASCKFATRFNKPVVLNLDDALNLVHHMETYHYSDNDFNMFKSQLQRYRKCSNCGDVVNVKDATVICDDCVTEVLDH